MCLDIIRGAVPRALQKSCCAHVHIRITYDQRTSFIITNWTEPLQNKCQ